MRLTRREFVSLGLDRYLAYIDKKAAEPMTAEEALFALRKAAASSDPKPRREEIKAYIAELDFSTLSDVDRRRILFAFSRAESRAKSRWDKSRAQSRRHSLGDEIRAFKNAGKRRPYRYAMADLVKWARLQGLSDEQILELIQGLSDKRTRKMTMELASGRPMEDVFGQEAPPHSAAKRVSDDVPADHPRA